MIVELGDITFNDTGRGWVFADLIDWYSLPDSKSPDIPIPQGHGSFNPGTDWRSAAAISFTAGYIGDSKAECLQAVEALNAIGGASKTMRVTDELRATSRTVSVRHIGVPDFFGYDQYEVHFAVDVLAWDPIRYADAEELVTGLPEAGGGLEYELYEGDVGGTLYYGDLGNLGRVTAVNTGTADTWPFFEVSGELTDGFYLQRLDTGDVLRYDRVVPAGSTVTIDSRTGAVLVDGVSDASTYLTRDQFFSVPAMGSVDIQFNAIGGSSGSPQLSVLVRSGWW